jgi:RNA polymerase sigma factor (sigma-70 family)
MTVKPAAFPETRLSVVQRLRSEDRGLRSMAFDALVTAYWKPVYTYLRLAKRAEPDEAEDLTQGFFAHAFEKRTLDTYDPARAKFRTWVRVCLDGYVANERKAAGRRKRGGDVIHVSLDFEDAEGELRERSIAGAEDVEAFFQREWTRRLLTLAVADLEKEALAAGQEMAFSIFERYDLEAPDEANRLTYAGLAQELGVTPTKVTNALHSMRSKLREHVLRRLRSVCGSESEAREEARALFGGSRGA